MLQGKSMVFDKVGELPAGDLIVRLKATDIILHYSGGETFVNQVGNVRFRRYSTLEAEDGMIGVAALRGESIDIEYFDTDGLFDNLEHSRVKNYLGDEEEVRRLLQTNPIFLLVSLTERGKELVSVPRVGDSVRYDTSVDKTLVGQGYELTSLDSLPDIDEALKGHASFLDMKTGRRDSLRADRVALEEAVRSLPEKANRVYVAGKPKF